MRSCRPIFLLTSDIPSSVLHSPLARLQNPNTNSQGGQTYTIPHTEPTRPNHHSKMNQATGSDRPRQMARKTQSPGARSLYSGESDFSHFSCPTSSCDSCFGFIYDQDLYESNSEELDEDDEHYDDDDDDDEDGSNNDWDKSQLSLNSTSTVCPTPVAGGHSHTQSQVNNDPFSMSSMSSLFGPPSWSFSSLPQQQSQGGSTFGAAAAPPPPPTSFRPPTSLGSKKKGSSRSVASQRCSCQKTSSRLPSASASGNANGVQNGHQSQNQNQTQTQNTNGPETQLSIFSNRHNGQNSQTGTGTGTGTGAENQAQTDNDQALGHLLANSRVGAKDKNGMIKNLNVYNPNITIQVTPENYGNFSKLFAAGTKKGSSGQQWNGSGSGSGSQK